MFIDTHCHLDEEYYEDIKQVIENIGDNIVIVSGVSDETNRHVVELCNTYDNVYGTIGIHPEEILNVSDDSLKFIADNINNPKIVGIGEIGLDYHYSRENIDIQKKFFIDQIKIANDNNIPIVVHSRDAIKDTYDILKCHLKTSAVIHCYSGSVEMAKEFIKLGMRLGIGGVLTFKNSKEIKEVVEQIDLKYILLETDSPFLTPEPYRGSRNEPKNVVYVAKKIADIKKISLDDVLTNTTRNAIEQFDLPIQIWYIFIDGDWMKYSNVKIIETLKNNNFLFKKKFGQNFIIDSNIIENIVKKSLIDNKTLVIEIGPGAGALTSELLKKAKQVICYEIDTTLKPVLDELENNFNNVDIIYADFLKCDVLNDLKKYSYERLYVVANLPYYITTPIIEKIIEDRIPVDKIVVMVQKEVANRFMAKSNTKEYGSLTLYLNYFFSIKKIMNVSRNVFFPRPNVDSVVVELSKKNNLLYVSNKEIFFQLLRDSFRQKRKNLKNNLKLYDLKKIEYILKKYNFDLNVRAEQLSLEQFVEIANYLSNN